MKQNRTQILQMLAEGKINVEEAERLMSLVEEPASRAGSGREAPARPKYLRVVVEPNPEKGEDASGERVNVRVPMALLRAGVRLTSLIPPMVEDPINKALKDQGIEVDLKTLKASDLEDLVDALADLHVDVESPEETVRVYVE